MAEFDNKNLQRYLNIRHRVEAGLWVLLFVIIFLSQTTIDLIDANRLNLDFRPWELITWKATSILTLLALIPLILWFDRRHPIKWTNWSRSVPRHVLFSVVFSALHVGIMLAMRHLVYRLNGSTYYFGDLLEQFGYEYLKDFQTYALLLSIIYLYRHVLLRLQGEASLLGEADTATKPGSINKPKRMLIKKLGREFLITVRDVERIEASGNYMNLYIGNRIYPLRETMANIEQRLDSSQFKRIHRSHIVNLSQIKEIIPLDNGDAQLLMLSGEVLPMSRTYRSKLLV